MFLQELVNGLSMESEWQQVSSNVLDYLQKPGRS